MQPIPRDHALDRTVALLTNGYRFVSERCTRFRSDVFEARLLGRSVHCVRGAEAARMFYHPDRFTRRGALPPTALALLQDFGSVARLDGAPHRHRKAMFLSLTTPARTDALVAGMREHWLRRAAHWPARGRVVLLHEARRILTEAVCEWAGVPLTAKEAPRRAREFGAMVEGAGAVGPRNWRAQLLRLRTERWARGVVRRIRAGTLVPPDDRAAAVIAAHRDADGRLLDQKVAAVELINVLRPTVAVDRYVVYVALALHEHPRSRERIARGDEEHLDRFVQEVRRHFPFIPLVGGRALVDFEWRGHPFAKGSRVLLDVHGTDHDPRLWQDPDRFLPDRFAGRRSSPFDLIPQGGGDPLTGHRCPGEGITIALMKEAARLLTRETAYSVPPQDLRVDMRRVPAGVRSGFVIEAEGGRRKAEG